MHSDLHDSHLVSTTRRDVTMQLQMPWGMLPQSWTQKLKSILDGVAMGTTKKADAHDPTVPQADKNIHKPFQETAILAWVACMACMWLTRWPPNSRIQHSRPQLGGSLTKKCGIPNTCWEMMQILKRVRLFFQEQKKLMIYLGALYHCHTPAGKLDEVLWFVVPRLTG